MTLSDKPVPQVAVNYEVMIGISIKDATQTVSFTPTSVARREGTQGPRSQMGDRCTGQGYRGIRPEAHRGRVRIEFQTRPDSRASPLSPLPQRSYSRGLREPLCPYREVSSS